MTIHVKAHAKINLALDVLHKRQDGYHELQMVTQSLGLCDGITLELTREPGFSVRSNKGFLPSDGRNLAAAAAKLFFSRAGELDGSVKDYCGGLITLDKRIPVCAGLGGGSADAGAVLRALNDAFDMPYESDGLHKLACELGSDVPFCLEGGTLLMEGRGERLTSLPPMPACAVVIAMPHGSMSTPQVFGWLNASKIRHRPDITGMLAALENGDLQGVARRAYNVLEDVVTPRMREVAGLHRQLIELGALGASMTGTGSAVFGIFDDDRNAASAAAAIERYCREVFVTRPVECAVKKP